MTIFGTAIALMVAFFQSYQPNPAEVATGKADRSVKQEGIITFPFLKAHPYAFESGGRKLALDVVEIPKKTLRKKVLVEGELADDNGMEILTKIKVNGVRLQTAREFAEAHKVPDPFETK